MQWWERLRVAMDARRLSPEYVAEKAGVHIKSLYGYLKGDVEHPRGTVVRRLAEAVQMTEQELRHGDVPGNTVTLKRIPLLDMTKLGRLKPGQDPLETWDRVSYVPVPQDVPDGAYGVTLVDESGGDTFRKGEVIVCDPAAEPIPGRFVVAVVMGNSSAHFARYRQLGLSPKRFILEHENKAFAEVEVGGKVKGFILARAIKHIRDI
jgi:SOS-response transcriptional repressor LexA